MALYLDHLAAAVRSIATVQQTRAAISHFHAAAVIRSLPRPSEVAQPGPDTQPGRRLTADVLNRVREVLRLPRRGHGAGQPQLPVMPRPRQAGALLCGRRVGVCNADPFPFPRSPFPSAYGLRLPHPVAGRGEP